MANAFAWWSARKRCLSTGEKGHFGYILEGHLEIEFDGGTHVFKEGDGVFIPDGAVHKHRAKVLSEVVRVIFVEDV